MFRNLGKVLAVGLFFAGLTALGWYLAKDRVRSLPAYLLTAKNISVTPPPVWVPEDFVRTVLQRSNLNNASLLDPALTKKLAEAFAASPWIERVDAVVLQYPSGAAVNVLYREPAALVELSDSGGTRLLPVDRNGIVLPAEHLQEIAPELLTNYMLIQGVRSMPLGSAGTPWGDPLVQTAAQLAAELKDVAEEMKLAKILPITEDTPSGMRVICRLKTAAGTDILWGHFVPEHPRNGIKKQRLRDLIKQYRSLDSVPLSFQPIDVSRE